MLPTKSARLNARRATRTSILKADKSQHGPPIVARLTALVRSLERRGAAAAEGVHGNEVCDACAYPGSEIAQISATAAVPLLILHVGPHPCSFRRSGERAGGIIPTQTTNCKRSVTIDRCYIVRRYPN